MPARPGLVLHVGQHKTGTTSIQEFLVAHRSALSAAGLWYPRAGLVGWQHGQLPAAWLGSHPHIPPHITQQSPGSVAAAIKQDRRPGTTMVLSSEIWCELIAQSPGDFDAAVRSLSSTFDVVPLIFVRNPAEKAWSALKHLARVGPPMDVGAVLTADLARDQAVTDHLASSYSRTVVTPYHQGDAVTQFLEVVRPLLPASWLRRQARNRRLDALIAARRSTVPARLNADLAHPKAAAVTMGTAQALWDARSFHTPRPTSMEGVFGTLFVDVGDAPELMPLPDEATMRERVVAAPSTTLADLLTRDEASDLARFWSRDDVARTCTEFEADAYRLSVLHSLHAQRTPPKNRA